MHRQEVTPKGVDKVSRYGWTTKDTPGKQMMLSKKQLKVNSDYQREVVTNKVKEMSSAWSWVACGSLTVALRDEDYWVIDGQHRLLAALRRSDIQSLPCLVFETEDVQDEAKGFLDANTGRKPVAAVEKHKAMVTAGDQTAVFVQEELKRLNLEVNLNARGAGQIRCIAWCYKRAKENRTAFQDVLELGAEICEQDGIPIPERVLDGLWVLNLKLKDGLKDKRLLRRVREKGAVTLLQAANKAAAYYASGGAGVWAKGMLAEMNKGLKHKFALKGAED